MGTGGHSFLLNAFGGPSAKRSRHSSGGGSAPLIRRRSPATFLNPSDQPAEGFESPRLAFALKSLHQARTRNARLDHSFVSLVHVYSSVPLAGENLQEDAANVCTDKTTLPRLFTGEGRV
jgi:hypothetical protein